MYINFHKPPTKSVTEPSLALCQKSHWPLTHFTFTHTQIATIHCQIAILPFKFQHTIRTSSKFLIHNFLLQPTFSNHKENTEFWKYCRKTFTIGASGVDLHPFQKRHQFTQCNLLVRLWESEGMSEAIVEIGHVSYFEPVLKCNLLAWINMQW